MREPAVIRGVLVAWLLLVRLVPSGEVEAGSGASAQEAQWQVEGQAREGLVYGPAGERTAPAPVVLAFHGYGDTMQNYRHTNVHGAWPEAIVVYFQGLNRGRGLPGWQVERDGADRDLQLVDVALAWIRETHDIDENRIYATGFSNGGMFAYLLWAERPDVFAAYAPVGARLPASVRPTDPRPIFHVAGARDRVVRLADQKAAIDVAIAVNGVDQMTTCGDGCRVYGADTPAPVMAWIHPGAHTYPPQTSAQIVSFFRRHSRSP